MISHFPLQSKAGKQKIRKAVFPVAGLGTRFLPATKAVPKEMLTVVDRPVVQLAVVEAREAGIEHFIFVTGRNKSVIEDHFDRQFELEATLKARNKNSELAKLAADLPRAGGEIQLTDAMIRLLNYQSFRGNKYEGTTYDCGDKVGYLMANVALALERDELRAEFMAALSGLLSRDLRASMAAKISETPASTTDSAQMVMELLRA